jgi:hypothetical protein
LGRASFDTILGHVYFVAFQKCRNGEKAGMQCHTHFNSTQFYELQSLFDCTKENRRIFIMRLKVNVGFPMECSTKDSYVKDPIGFNPTNQTIVIGKKTKEFRSSRFPTVIL